MTPQEARDLIAKHGSISAAAKAIGRNRAVIQRALDPDTYNAKARARAARAPRGPRNAPTVPHVPEAHEIRGVSTLVSADGELAAQWTKTGLAGGETEQLPPEFSVRRVSTMTGADGTTRVKWTSADRDRANQWAAFTAGCAEHVAQYRGIAEPLPPPADTQETLTVHMLGDPHAGMLAWAPETGEHHDLAIWSARLRRALDLAVASSPPSRDAWIINIGDALHAQNAEQRTPGHGHKLDVDGRHGKVMRVFFDTFRWLIDRTLQKHERVSVFNLPGNHDPEVAAMIAMFLGAVYEREPRVTIDPGHAPYVYRAYGSTLIGMHHGDGAKQEALPGIMAHDVPELWGAAKHRVWLTGHVHHQVRKDFPGCSVESFRILPPGDFWHRSKGYRAPRSQHTITYHPEFGEILRGTFDISRIDEREST